MSESVRFADEQMMSRRYEYADGTVLAVDLGHVDGATVDVVDGTVIVVTPADQYELELPTEATAEAAVNNGVLTVELTGQARTDEFDIDVDGDEVGA